MTAAVASKDFYLDEFTWTTPLLPASNSARVKQLRESALARFEELGFPAPREEDWKYTRLTSFESQPFRVSPKDDISVKAEMIKGLAWAELPGHRLVFVDGYFAPSLSSVLPLPEGISFTPLAEALTQEDENVIAIMEQAIQDCVNGFAALNIAYLSDGACLRVAKNTVVPEPVNLVFVNRGVENSVAHTRNLLFLEQGSEVSITETYVGLGDNNYFTNTQSEIVLGENANLNHYKLQQEGGKGNHIAGLNAVQQAHSYLGCHNLSLGSLLMRQDITNVMAAEGSECLINGLMLGRDRQHMDLHTRIEHTKPHCTSREYFRGILDDRARGVVDGRVIVHPQAQKTDAHLASNNLLLSRHSEMDVKPQLEIYADDVKCTHGTTVGQMDDDALFYLRSRGLDEEAARALVTYAFANDILSRVPSEAIRSSSQNLLISRMPQARYIKELL